MTQTAPVYRPPTAEVIARHQAELPVDVEALARDFGIDLRYVDFGTLDIAGKLERRERAPGDYAYMILVNRRHGERRKRFTIAHEIAHYVLHRHLMEDEIVDDTMYRSNLRNEYEREADSFAADILLPPSVVKREYRKNPALHPLAETFNVSEAALRIRLKQLGVRA